MEQRSQIQAEDGFSYPSKKDYSIVGVCHAGLWLTWGWSVGAAFRSQKALYSTELGHQECRG
ncbi:hypothetical protein [Mesorhizobium sp. M1E.F.Ca.ET.041.01.1.1]|uniref:hypothetical protein n=1 Tax=Mesorhizobium sp. M1E.F.Ca.ET.041.01.1.1 TaxID=2496759 RepID=UPI000FCBE124|nr:hypothetical protein [Mesorhizobium sp. M1E.F.Ca.ET.041.01.1.1]RUW33883.1 hypothetical protein EOA38_11825 [Mesorhizobium sp. M1E.F.Ca.ET.041.01.1.1]